jgi:hypothetical protein
MIFAHGFEMHASPDTGVWPAIAILVMVVGFLYLLYKAMTDD